MKEKDANANDSLSGARRTRSQAAPDWTVTESLILVNEIAAVEADCSRALSSYQQWNIIVGNCAALDVDRNLNQCRRKWDSLLSEYDKIREWESKHTRGSYWNLKSERAKKLGLPESFDPELFEAIDAVAKAREERGEVEPESDPEAAGNEMLDVTVEIGHSDSNSPNLFPNPCWIFSAKTLLLLKAEALPLLQPSLTATPCGSTASSSARGLKQKAIQEPNTLFQCASHKHRAKDATINILWLAINVDEKLLERLIAVTDDILGSHWQFSIHLLILPLCSNDGILEHSNPIEKGKSLRTSHQQC